MYSFCAIMKYRIAWTILNVSVCGNLLFLYSLIEIFFFIYFFVIIVACLFVFNFTIFLFFCRQNFRPVFLSLFLFLMVLWTEINGNWYMLTGEYMHLSILQIKKNETKCTPQPNVSVYFIFPIKVSTISTIWKSMCVRVWI